MNLTEPKQGTSRPKARVAMLYSAESLGLVDEFASRLSRLLKRAALDRAKQEGRDLVTGEDIDAIITEFGWTIPDEDEPDGR